MLWRTNVPTKIKIFDKMSTQVAIMKKKKASRVNYMMYNVNFKY